MKTKVLALPILAAVLLLVVIFGHPLVLPHFLNKKFKTLTCAPCKIQVQGARVTGIAPLSILLSQLEIDLGDPEFSHWKIEIPETKISFSRNPITSKHPSLKNLRIQNLQVLLSEKKDSPKNSNKAPSFPKFSIDSFKVRNGSFKYVSLDPKGAHPPGQIDFRNISLDISPFSSLPSVEAQQKINGKIQGQLGEGWLRLELNLAPTFKQIDLDLKAQLEDLKIQSMNSYLTPVESISLSGNLREGHIESQMRGNNLRTQSRVLYDKLDAKLHPSSNGGSVISSVVEGLMNFQMCDTNKNRSGLNLDKTSNIQRKDESVVQFLLRGMLETGIQLSCLDGLPI